MATAQTMADSGTDTLLGEVLKNFAQDEASHNDYTRKVEEWYKAYRGVLEIRSKAAGWTSRQHPPYIHQVIETMVSSMLDPDPRWKVKPRPRMADDAEIQQLRDGAKANELLLAQQADCDRLGEKQVLFAKQCLIAGLSVYKTFWQFTETAGKRQAIVHEPVHDSEDYLLGFEPRATEETFPKVKYDDNACEVIDVRDFIWHEAAISLEKAKRVTHRVLYSMEELRSLEKLGVYQNVDQLHDTDSTAPEYASREQSLFEVNRAKDMVEVLEQWRRTDSGIRVTSVGNRSVLLRDKPNPFWHGQFPFVVCSSVPDLFRIPGISEVELVRDLQELLWTMINQRIDNTHLLNNAIVLIREDADDYEQFEWVPGAQWIVQDPQQVSLLPINPAPAEVSLQAETRALQDLQNISGASPALLGQMDNSANTATEVSLTSSLGQRRLAAKKQQMKFCHGRVGEQWMENNQQFIRDDRLLAVTGPGGEQAFRKISPLVLQGDYAIDLEAMDESLMRQERKAEAQATFQVAMAAAPIFAALSQNPNTPTQMLDMKAFMDDVLEAAGISDKDRYYLDKQTPVPQLPAPAQNGNGGPPQAGSGVTAPPGAGVVDPQAMQQMMSQRGGSVNIPSG